MALLQRSRLPVQFAFATFVSACAAGFSALPAVAQSDPVADFYKGRNITMLVGFSTGNGADSYGRLLARHIGKHLPGNPNVIVQNMPGSGSLVMANYLYSVAPKDGSVIGIFNRNVPMEPMMGNKNARFEARKFTWIGSANTEPSLCVAWGASPIKTWEDTKQREWVIAATGLNANSGLVPTLLNRVLGTRMKLIMGYPGASEMSLAMESGEVEGRCGWSRSSLMATKAQWVTDKKVNLLIQAGLQKNPALMDVPLAMDYVTNDRDKQLLKLAVAWDEMAWPFMAPPEVPAARRDALRKAFESALADPQLLAEAEREKLDVTLVTGESIEKLLDDVYSTPPDIVAEMRGIITPSR
ncbi:MAG: tripartite tricarboxylate transporter family receptor [Hyphomicrobiales bacterium]|nr:tripartite tricarboxylate transporter family receptor [Hyphomicrobiales bacterium]